MMLDQQRQLLKQLEAIDQSSQVSHIQGIVDQATRINEMSDNNYKI